MAAVDQQGQFPEQDKEPIDSFSLGFLERLPDPGKDPLPFYKSLSSEELIKLALYKDQQLAEQRTQIEELRAAADTQSALSIRLLEEHVELVDDSKKDSLTGLLNFAGLSQIYHSRIQFRHPSGSTQALVIDTDRFKELNDTSGHGAGNVALQRVAAALESSIRPTDILGRFGGDEFVVFASDATPEEAETIAKRMSERVAAAFADVGDNPSPIIPTLSIGIAEVGYDQNIIGGIADADRAMYEAKRNGRNQFHTFDPNKVYAPAPRGRE